MAERFKIYEIIDEQGQAKWWVFDEKFSQYDYGHESKAQAQFEADKLNYIDNMGQTR